MIRHIIVSVASGILFGVMDGIINANPLATRLFEIYKPIARTSFNPLAGIAIDLVFGFVMAGVFLNCSTQACRARAGWSRVSVLPFWHGFSGL